MTSVTPGETLPKQITSDSNKDHRMKQQLRRGICMLQTIHKETVNSKEKQHKHRKQEQPQRSNESNEKQGQSQEKQTISYREAIVQGKGNIKGSTKNKTKQHVKKKNTFVLETWTPKPGKSRQISQLRVLQTAATFASPCNHRSQSDFAHLNELVGHSCE